MWTTIAAYSMMATILGVEGWLVYDFAKWVTEFYKGD